MKKTLDFNEALTELEKIYLKTDCEIWEATGILLDKFKLKKDVVLTELEGALNEKLNSTPSNIIKFEKYKKVS
jgi:hypothetical protein